MLKGTLLFKGWQHRPWALAADDGEIHDLWPSVDAVLLSMAKRPARHDEDRHSYTLSLDLASEFDLEYESGRNPVLVKREGFGFSNTGLYIARALQRLNGRTVTIETSADRFAVAAAAAEAVPVVRYYGDGNHARLWHGDAKDICKPGTTDCCIFLAAGADGFSCLKFSGSAAETLLDRLATRSIRASRIGNCACHGREK